MYPILRRRAHTPSSTMMAQIVRNQRPRRHLHSSFPYFMVLIVSTFLFYQPQNDINYYVHAFTTIQQQQQQQQSDSQNNQIPTNHHPHQQQQHHRSLSSTATNAAAAAAASNAPFKATHAAITMDSFTTTPTRRGSSSRGTTSTSIGTSPEKTNFKIVPSLGFGGNNGAVAAVAPYTLNEAEGVTANDPYYYYLHQHHHHHSQLADDDDDEELMGLGTALVTCAMSLVIGFTLGYGT